MEAVGKTCLSRPSSRAPARPRPLISHRAGATFGRDGARSQLGSAASQTESARPPLRRATPPLPGATSSHGGATSRRAGARSQNRRARSQPGSARSGRHVARSRPGFATPSNRGATSICPPPQSKRRKMALYRYLNDPLGTQHITAGGTVPESSDSFPNSQ